jgi:hypothetical protein
LFLISIKAVAVSYDNDNELDFTWTAASGNVDHYNVYVSNDGGEYILVGTTSETSYVVNGQNGSTYKIKVQAADAAGNVGLMSEESDSVICDTSFPESVSDLHLTVSGNTILLEWTGSADAVSYNVYRDTASDFIPDKTNGSNRIATNVNDEKPDTSGIQWTDTGDGVLLVGDTSANYFYVVTAVDATGNESDSSNKVGEFDIKLVAGAENLISLPLKLSKSYTSYSFLEEISPDVEVPFLPQITRFNPDTQNWESAYCDNGTIIGVQFPIVEGEGYCVQVSRNIIYTFTGDVITIPITLNLKRGNNLIGIPYSAEEYTSYTLILSIPDCIRVMRYNIDSLSWEVAYLNESRIEGVDFNIKVGEGYYVYTMSDISWSPDSTIAPMIIPEKTELVQNYPNPFNPETWIPFQLSKPSEVNIRIYNAGGKLVKTLQLGYKSAGMYIERSKAAYWDGRNDIGEKVSSGIYFYELQTDTFREIRKMVLLK